jgi:transcriptional regulator with XRE-family HTH domain
MKLIGKVQQREMSLAGMALRKIRDSLGLTMRDVEKASEIVSRLRGSREYLIAPSRLSDIEKMGVVPSVFRFYSLAVIYRRPVRELFQLYGIDLDGARSDWGVSQPPNSYLVRVENEQSVCEIPVKQDQGFDLRETSNVSRMVRQWGTVPFSLLVHLASPDYTYGFIGMEDFTMHPILPPGTFVQVDVSKRVVMEQQWRSEYDRPIYFVETREGLTCCWCSLGLNSLVLQSHPLSPTPVRIFKYPQGPK